MAHEHVGFLTTTLQNLAISGPFRSIRCSLVERAMTWDLASWTLFGQFPVAHIATG